MFSSFSSKNPQLQSRPYEDVYDGSVVIERSFYTANGCPLRGNDRLRIHSLALRAGIRCIAFFLIAKKPGIFKMPGF